MSGTCLITGTPLLRLGGKLVKGFMRTSEQGAATPTHLALSPEVNGVGGKYFNAHQVIVDPSSLAQDKHAQDKSWRKSLELLGLEQIDLDR